MRGFWVCYRDPSAHTHQLKTPRKSTLTSRPCARRAAPKHARGPCQRSAHKSPRVPMRLTPLSSSRAQVSRRSYACSWSATSTHDRVSAPPHARRVRSGAPSPARAATSRHAPESRPSASRDARGYQRRIPSCLLRHGMRAPPCDGARASRLKILKIPETVNARGHRPSAVRVRIKRRGMREGVQGTAWAVHTANSLTLCRVSYARRPCALCFGGYVSLSPARACVCSNRDLECACKHRPRGRDRGAPPGVLARPRGAHPGTRSSRFGGLFRGLL